MTPAGITFRPMTPGDITASADVHFIADDALSRSRGLPTGPRNRQALEALIEHVVRVSPDRSWVAERDRQVVGFGSSIAYDDLVFLSFLFVVPDLQAGGIGRELLERSMHDSAYRAVCIASYQPVSAALYAHYGMAPLVPLYMFLGRPARSLPALPPGFEIGPIDDEATDALDMELCRLTRRADHAFWQRLGRRRYGLFERGAPVGYGYAQDSGRIAPLLVRDGALTMPFLGRLMAALPPVDSYMVNVPGPAGPNFVALLHAGMRLEGPPAIFCATELRIDHSRYLPASFALP